VTRVELFGIRRTQHISDARQAVMALACKLTRMSTPDIGRRIGGRDHTTVLHARDKLKSLIDQIQLSEDEAPAVWVNALANLMPKWTRGGENGLPA
jgi:chromosomal replication initiation ATPase DnaA